MNINLILKIQLILIITLIVLIGCAGGNRSGSSESTQSEMPNWFSKRELSDDVYIGVGMAKKQKPSLALKVATARARDDIAKQISLKVENMMQDFMQESGIGKNAESLEFTSSVAQQIANTTLRGSSVELQERAEDGTWYVRVIYSKVDAKNAVLESVRLEKSLFNEFKVQQGFKDLEKIIQSMD